MSETTVYGGTLMQTWQAIKMKWRAFKANEKQHEKIGYWVTLSISVLMVFICGLMLLVPLITTSLFSFSPLHLIANLNDIRLVDFGGIKSPEISLYTLQFGSVLFAGFLALVAFLMLYNFIVMPKKFHKRSNSHILTLLICLFVFRAFCVSFVDVFKEMYPGIDIHTSGYTFFTLGCVLFVLKIISGALFSKQEKKDNMKESASSIKTSFVLMFLVLITLVLPVYAFPGTEYSLTGAGILFGSDDVLSFLAVSNIKSWFRLLLFTSLISFIVNIVLYLKSRRTFIQYDKINKLLSYLTIILYTLLGICYAIVYIDAEGYNTYFHTSASTYCFVPLVMLLLFGLGVWFSKITSDKLNIEYKFYNKAEGSEGGGSNPFDHGSSGDPIPAFSELDKRAEEFELDYSKRKTRNFADITLPKLVSHIIEYAKNSKERLSYGPVEIKTFISGIAVSRLSILQGMSGTGKTSLPKCFMESIDGICDIVAVESSWRDKNELLGYYNEFNKKYTPKSFTQFLYKAALNKDIPYFIVLDEMNLSRIEYYFSDFLSLMETRENARNIKLFDVQLYPYADKRANYIALRDGHTIDIPTNVWFIGTANRDESTFEISDKVYDRAQTMNFDKRAPKITGTLRSCPPKFVSYAELRKLFDSTKSITFDAENSTTIKQVEKILRPYKISFGNRVLKQIEGFVKVYVACSDNDSKYIHEAIDAIMLSKVVRKLELKQIADIDSLIDEFGALNLTMCKEFLQTLGNLD